MNMTRYLLEGTPEQLAERLATLPVTKRYRLIEIGEEKPAATREEIDAANARLESLVFNSGKPPLTNEDIDRLLGEEYGSDHAELYRNKEGK